jgi:hypothetical protein
MESQARIEKDNGGRAVFARVGGSSRQLGVIDDQGSVEERKGVVVLVRGSISGRMCHGNTPNRKEIGSHDFVGKVHVIVLVDAMEFGES